MLLDIQTQASLHEVLKSIGIAISNSTFIQVNYPSPAGNRAQPSIRAPWAFNPAPECPEHSKPVASTTGRTEGAVPYQRRQHHGSRRTSRRT